MTEQIKLKLSELPDETNVSYEDANTIYSVAELKNEILVLGEPHHKITNWAIAIDATWTPSASRMIEDYIENQADDMYEDWDERANDCIEEEIVSEIQFLLEKMFKMARGYWTFGDSIEIDVFPPTKYNIYKVDEDYIVAETQEQALECHLEAVGREHYCGEKPEIEMIDPSTIGCFETDTGHEEKTFGEWLADYDYIEPVIICWNE